MKIKLDFISLVRARPKIAQRLTDDENMLAAIGEYKANRGKQAEIYSLENVQRLVRKSQ